MPYLPGEPLALLEMRQGPGPVDEGIPLLLQICRGLEHAHGLQILHRDLDQLHAIMPAPAQINASTSPGFTVISCRRAA